MLFIETKHLKTQINWLHTYKLSHPTFQIVSTVRLVNSKHSCIIHNSKHLISLKGLLPLNHDTFNINSLEIMHCLC